METTAGPLTGLSPGAPTGALREGLLQMQARVNSLRGYL